MKKLMLSLFLVSIIYVFTAFGASLHLYQPAIGIASWSDTTWTRFDHIRTAAINYSSSLLSNAPFIALHFDLSINPSADNGFLDSLDAMGTDIKKLIYLTINGIRDSDTAQLRSFCVANGYNFDSMFMWVDADSTISIDCNSLGSGICDAVYTSNGGDSLNYCLWTSKRISMDTRRTEMWEYIVYKFMQGIGTDYHGVMQDEDGILYYPDADTYCGGATVFPFTPDYWTAGSPSAANGWDNMTHNQVRDSIVILKQEGWLKLLMDSLYVLDFMRFGNPAAYGVVGTDVIDDCIKTGTGVLLGEGMDCTPINTDWNTTIWNVMDTIVAADSGYAIVWLYVRDRDTVRLESFDRCQMDRLAFYYMAADYEHFYFMLTGNMDWLHPNDWSYTTDSLYKWFDALEYDIGQPDSARYVDTSGTDNLGQSFTIYCRDFTDGSTDARVFYRPASRLTKSISGATSAGGGDSVTFTTTTAHGIIEGSFIQIYGTTDYNNENIEITSASQIVDATHFTISDTYVSDQSGTVLVANYKDTTQVPVALGGDYYPIDADGNTGSATDTAWIRNAEGVIMVAQSAGEGGSTKNKRYRGKITIKGAKH